MIILSIETSCDETAVAITEFEENNVKVLANIVSSQIKLHKKYGGVVPSLASRAHLKNMAPVLSRTFRMAKIEKSKIDYIAVTNGPGLIPALMIGVQAAKTLSYALNKPLIGINHIEGHIYANWLKPIGENSKSEILNSKQIPNSEFQLWAPEFPILCLIISGGHTQLILMKKDLGYKIVGETLDDAAGEAFDKIAKLLGLGYPGGPLIEKLAKKGNRSRFRFPRPMINSKDYNFSFSGLKTAVLYEMRRRYGIERVNMENSGSDITSQSPALHGPSENSKAYKCHSRPVSHCGINSGGNPEINRQLMLTGFPTEASGMTVIGQSGNIFKPIDSQYKADIAASFQQAIVDVLIYKAIAAARNYEVKNVLLGGGVSANEELRKQMNQAVKKELTGAGFYCPSFKLAADNALMVSIAAYKRIAAKKGIKNWKNIRADANLRLR